MIHSLDELIDFSQSYAWQYKYSASVVRRFLAELISGSDLIFEVQDSSGRAAAAVLIDKIQNPTKDANLEILGIRPDLDPGPILADFLKRAQAHTPASKSGFQAFLLEGFPEFESIFLRHGLKEHYSVYDMHRADLEGVHKGFYDEIQKAKPSDAEETYQVLCRSFMQNLETNIPDLENWSSKFAKSPDSHIYLWRKSGRIVGFVSLTLDESGGSEVHTLGVLPEERGHGIGAKLLHHCLLCAIDLGATRSQLTVAAANPQALGLYKKFGFQMGSVYKCFRWSRTP